MSRGAHVITLTVSLLPVFNVMVFDTRVLPEPTAKQQELTVQGVVQMVMNMKDHPRYLAQFPAESFEAKKKKQVKT